MAQNVLIQNKKARFQYEFIEKLVAGIELYGTEIKSIRQGKASLVDAYCRFVTHVNRPGKPELYIFNAYFGIFARWICQSRS
jgi:SsrA-binding protein